MTRQEAEQILIYWDDLVWQRDNHITCGMISEALNLATEALNPWHKVSEELPKERAFLVCKMGKQPIYKTLEYSSERDGFWTSSGGFITRDGVREYFTHWMPIPEIKED